MPHILILYNFQVCCYIVKLYIFELIIKFIVWSFWHTLNTVVAMKLALAVG